MSRFDPTPTPEPPTRLKVQPPGGANVSAAIGTLAGNVRTSQVRLETQPQTTTTPTMKQYPKTLFSLTTVITAPEGTLRTHSSRMRPNGTGTWRAVTATAATSARQTTKDVKRICLFSLNVLQKKRRKLAKMGTLSSNTAVNDIDPTIRRQHYHALPFRDTGKHKKSGIAQRIVFNTHESRITNPHLFFFRSFIAIAKKKKKSGEKLSSFTTFQLLILLDFAPLSLSPLHLPTKT